MDTTERILDAAWACFAEKGIRATTMEHVAQRAGLSRVWVYRKLGSREGLVRALVQREVRRFLVGLDAEVDPTGDPLQLLSGAFAYAVSFLRQHELLNRLLETEPETLLPYITIEAGPVVAQAAAGMLPRLLRWGWEEAAAGRLAEAMVRLVVSTVIIPPVRIDFDDTAEVQRFFGEVFAPAIVAAPRAEQRAAHRTTSTPRAANGSS